ncbi:Lrp/AsnC family transcriptional regulator [Paenibacillus silvae]|uniref:Lrp/AsnC family transcriptional regulator n=1 Tax=Paenibacillus TaxID=44249 RepID=UPI001C0FF2D9|nr:MULTISPECIES: Lrp/AsnC family transcriptional regulator [Paenibacillus]MBU5351759.1 Lrp/AsnC family transcriptional regulator [Paenibacillus barcinonensis]MCK6073263.1 Lrp/AsnC family transcriptional regulator [Paenibacillus silvae]MCK6149261.1 Lrp/AsnC family transcriptional regulator [Paenibacillus silvae]MCK6267560.1 Lrp/AsnC family transcriptional regulator [Paenibacillus silvae]MDM5277619.1 Lrp/AsnC family transcriptional regulator [Paenibacillus silvae]
MDEIDKNILLHLQNQARLSMTDLGKLVGLSQPAVTERVKRMEEKGVIEEYRTVISSQKLGKQCTAYMLVRTRNCYPFLDFCRSSPEVIECSRISGEHNYLLKVLTETTQELEEFENRCDQFGTYTTLIVMSSPIAYKNLIEEANLLT